MQIGKIETVFNQSVLVLASGIFVHYNFLFTTSLQLFFTTYFTTFFICSLQFWQVVQNFNFGSIFSLFFWCDANIVVVDYFIRASWTISLVLIRVAVSLPSFESRSAPPRTSFWTPPSMSPVINTSSTITSLKSALSLQVLLGQLVVHAQVVAFQLAWAKNFPTLLEWFLLSIAGHRNRNNSESFNCSNEFFFSSWHCIWIAFNLSLPRFSSQHLSRCFIVSSGINSVPYLTSTSWQSRCFIFLLKNLLPNVNGQFLVPPAFLQLELCLQERCTCCCKLWVVRLH